MTYYNNHNNKIRGTRIELDPAEKNNRILLTHELGHALGLDHADQYDYEHIMHHEVMLYTTRL